MQLPEDFLCRLEAELELPGMRGLALTGSWARGDASAGSDVDVLRFVVRTPSEAADRYALRIVEGRLVSISTASVESKMRELERPESAIWAVPGLRQARVLVDRDGSIARLLDLARHFVWDSVADRARDFASASLMGFAEETAKVLGALNRDDAWAAIYGALGLVSGMADAMAVRAGLLIESENRFFPQLYDSVGPSSRWARLHRTAAGFTRASGGDPRLVRSIAALHLYAETVDRLRDSVRPEHAEVVDHALAQIAAAELPRGEA